MHQLRINRVSNLNAHVFNKTKKMKKFKKTYEICSIPYFTIFKNITITIEQKTKCSFQTKSFRKVFECRYKYPNSNKKKQLTEKKTFISESKNEKTIKKTFVLKKHWKKKR